MSDTPRTDDEESHECNMYTGNKDLYYVTSQFARMLERENTALNTQIADARHQLHVQRVFYEEQLGKIIKSYDGARGEVEKLTAQIAEARHQLHVQRVFYEAQLGTIIKSYDGACGLDSMDEEYADAARCLDLAIDAARSKT